MPCSTNFRFSQTNNFLKSLNSVFEPFTFRTACNLHECCITAEQCHKKEVIKNRRKDNMILQLFDQAKKKISLVLK